MGSELARVSEDTLKSFDEVCAKAEAAVVAECLAADSPEEKMGPEAEGMLRNGMQFVTKMLRASMQFGAGGILADQVQWGKTRLPEYGAGVEMVRRNLERYAEALRTHMPAEMFEELEPYLTQLISGDWSE